MSSVDNGILIIKMKNGYNIGISKDNILSIEKIEIGKPRPTKKPKINIEKREKPKKHIHPIHWGHCSL